MDNALEKQKKPTELNDGDRKVLYKYATHYYEFYDSIPNVESCNALDNSISNSEKYY